MRRRCLRLEVDPSLCVFRKTWAAKGREFEIVASEVNPGKGLFINELAAEMQCGTERAHQVWLAVSVQ